jgi:hypothetical protein
MTGRKRRRWPPIHASIKERLGYNASDTDDGMGKAQLGLPLLSVGVTEIGKYVTSKRGGRSSGSDGKCCEAE